MVSSHTAIPGKWLLPFRTPGLKGVFPLLFIVTAGVSSHSLLWLLLFFKATGSCYCLILVEFLQFVLSVATLLKAPETLYLSSKCQLPLGPSCSGKWNFPVQTSPSLLILDLAAN